mgnify:FL=1|tara:strand:- start:54 stop:407 length:354 start_codon:yes stop_codon:yes gene_type:complete
MAISRYSGVEEQQLKDLDYKKVYKDKFNKNKKAFLAKKATADLNYPSFNDIMLFKYEVYVWTVGDHYYKLAQRFYGDPRYWWVIAWFNKKPTESHVAVGDLIRIPTPLGQVLTSIGL